MADSRPSDIRRIIAEASMRRVNEKAERLVKEAKDTVELLALAAAGGRANDMVKRLNARG